MQQTDKEFLQALQVWMVAEGWTEYNCTRLQNIIDDIPNTEALVAEAKKRVDILCEKRKIPENVLANESYLAEQEQGNFGEQNYLFQQEQGYLFHPSIKSSNL